MERKLLKRYMDAKDGQLTPQPIYGDTQLLREASCGDYFPQQAVGSVSYTHLRAHETRHDLVCRLLLEKKKTQLSLIHISYPTRQAENS